MSITTFGSASLSRVPILQGVNVKTYRSRSKLVFVATSDATANTGFKYLFQIKNGATTLAEAYVTANPADKGMIDISPYVRELVSLPAEDVGGDHIHKGVNNTKYLTKVEGAAKIITVTPGEVYESSGTLTEFPDTGEDDVALIFHGAYALKDMIPDSNDNASQNLIPFATCDSGEFSVKGFLSTIEPDTYSHIPRAEYLKGVTGAVYAVPVIQKGVKIGDLGQLAWIHDSTYFGGESEQVTIQYYDIDDNLLYTLNIDSTDPTLAGGQALNATDEDGKILAVPAYEGAQDNNTLINTLRNANAATWNYYTIQLTDQVQGNPTKKWVFFQHCPDNRFRKYQIAWDNGVGFYDYYTFYLKSEQTKRTETKYYSTNTGTWEAASYTQRTYDRNVKPYRVDEELEYKLYTGKIPEATARYLKGILSSRKIDIIDDEGVILPVICTDSSLTYGVDTTNTMREYSFTFKLAQTIEA